MKEKCSKLVNGLNIAGLICLPIGVFLPYFTGKWTRDISFIKILEELDDGASIGIILTAFLFSIVAAACYSSSESFAPAIFMLISSIAGYVVVNKVEEKALYRIVEGIAKKTIGSTLLHGSYILLIGTGILALIFQIIDVAQGNTSKSKMVCPSCGALMESNCKFCVTCGHKFPEMVCPSCGAKRSEGQAFCFACGMEFVNDDTVDNKEEQATSNETESEEGKTGQENNGDIVSVNQFDMPVLSVSQSTSDVKTCPSCGQALFPKSKFCGACGTVINEDKTVMFCTSCGTQRVNDELFCHSCGKKYEATV